MSEVSSPAFGPKPYDRRAGVALRIAWCERWLSEGHKQLTPEWANLLEDAKWLLAQVPEGAGATDGPSATHPPVSQPEPDRRERP